MNFVPWIVIRAVFCFIAFSWSIYASLGFLKDVQLDKRRLLAIYPMFMFYFMLSWVVNIDILI